MTQPADRFATFDLEVAKDFANGNWRSFAPLGITCAALGLSDAPEPTYFRAVPQMSRAACVEMLRQLEQVVANGNILVTWNGTAFDLAVLAQETGMPRECAQLALAHVDLMLIVTFKRGHFLGLQKALDGAGIPGKLQEVTLNNGTRDTAMSGKRAPQMWRDGEYDAVLAYLREDVMPLLELTQKIARRKIMEWTSGTGTPQSLPLDKLWTVRECLSFPLPDIRWMKSPPKRSDLVGWLEPYV